MGWVKGAGEYYGYHPFGLQCCPTMVKSQSVRIENRDRSRAVREEKGRRKEAWVTPYPIEGHHAIMYYNLANALALDFSARNASIEYCTVLLF